MSVGFIYSSEGIFCKFLCFYPEMCRLESWGHHAPNIFKFGKKLVERQPCWKRVGNSNFSDPIFVE